MRHSEFKKIFSLILDNEATAQEKLAAEEHLKACPSCRAYAAELNNLSSLLKTWNDENPSPDLEQQFKNKFDGRRQKEGFTMRKRYLEVAVTVVVLIVGLVGLQQYTHRGLQARVRTATDSISSVQLAKVAPQNGYYFSKGLVTGAVKGKMALGSARVSDSADSMQLAYTTAEYEPYYSNGASVSAGVPGSTATQYGLSDGSIKRGLTVQSARLSEGVSKDFLFYSPAPEDREEYSHIDGNKFLEVAQEPLSTFSIDVDTASYSNIRRFLDDNQMPPQGAVRVEEMINYFAYDYPQPQGNDPFSISLESGACPWQPEHRLVLVGIQGKDLDTKELPESNLVFLIDVSGSMRDSGKIDLLKKSFRLMVEQLTSNERVAIVTYAENAKLVLDSTSGDQKKKILDVIDHLNAGGSTAGAAGIQLAYEVAQKNFVKGGNNRVILATDGDFNVGASSETELVSMIQEKRSQGIFLTVLGFGVGDYKDNKMQQLADKGNGSHYYIDNLNEGKKVMVSELGSTLFTIAKDVKIQIEFNPAIVKAYRLIGYENRILAKEDFKDDTKDAGELGAGHTVTALYEIIPAWSSEKVEYDSDGLKYQTKAVSSSDDLLTIKLSYKAPEENKSQIIERSLQRKDAFDISASTNFQFASAVAEFGLLLRNSEHKTKASYAHVLNAAVAAKGNDPWGYRAEFIDLVKKAKSLDVRSEGPGMQFKGTIKKK